MAEVLELFGEEYYNNNTISFEQHKVISNILNCRTSVMGEHWYKCDQCDHMERVYNSCGDRHCPSCQGVNKERWILERTYDLLPVRYFHVVFTVPSELRLLFLQNKEILYNLLFSAAWESLKEFGLDKRQQMEAELGAISILHTWTQQLLYHPHIHMIVPEGGIDKTGKWKKSKGNQNFLFWTQAVANKFRGKFLDQLYKLFLSGKLKCNGDIKHLATKNLFYKFKDSLYQKQWVVNCKKPFENPQYVIEYLARYTHKIAISNYRILNINEQEKTITFSYLDRSDGNKKKSATIPAETFIKRFLLHILPKGFTKIRHYGFLASRVKTEKLEIIRDALMLITPIKQILKVALVMEMTLGKHSITCKCCKKGTMQHVAFKPRNRGQPVFYKIA